MLMLNRTQAPETSLPKELRFPKINRFEMDNNLAIYGIGGAGEPIVHMYLVLESGRYFEAKRLAATLTGYMVNKGTSTKNAEEISESLDFHGANLRVQSNMYLTTISLSCLKNQFPKVLPLLHEMLVDASFPENELDLLKQRIVQKLKVNLERNKYIASQQFNTAIYGASHAFGYETTIPLVQEVDVDTVQTHFKNNYELTSYSKIIVSGDIGEVEFQLINKYFGQAALASREIPSPFQASENKQGKKIESTIDGSVQASIRVGNLTIPFDHVDFTDLNTVNTILGGYFGSRLMSNIREEKGYTYGVYSLINPIMDSCYFCIYTDVGVKYKEATLKEISKEIKRLQTEPVGENELNMVKNYLVGRMMKSVDGPLKMAATLKELLVFNQDLSILNKQLHAVQSIQPERVLEIAQTYFNYEKMYKVVAS